jgi:1-acyl-sn-glycerol-3-phosphate acyltransferase
MLGNIPYYFARFLTTAPPCLAARVYFDGWEHVPKRGPALMLSNHISHFDPPLLALNCPAPIHYMADKPMLEIPIAGPLLKMGHAFPIDRTKNDRAALRTAMDRLKAGNVVGIFPEGGIRHGKTAALAGAEVPVGTASLWRMMNVPVIPMVIIGSDQLYALKNWLRRPRVFVRAGRLLPAPEEGATREALRDRIIAAWRELYEGMIRDYAIRPEELPQSAQQRWGTEPWPAPEGGATTGPE